MFDIDEIEFLLSDLKLDHETIVDQKHKAFIAGIVRKLEKARRDVLKDFDPIGQRNADEKYGPIEEAL